MSVTASEAAVKSEGASNRACFCSWDTAGGGNCGVCVGVFGDESGADSGDESTSIGGGRLI